ncbi:MAG: nitrous oxide reductase family maturation protein NosD [bacterium]|nr:nitrous oxide reductase family maturation protein NosD [bacterium]
MRLRMTMAREIASVRLFAAVTCLLTALVLMVPSPAKGRTLWVHPDSTLATISQGIGAAQSHDTLVISVGTYSADSLIIGIPLTLSGQPGAIVRAGGKRGIFVVTAPHVTIRNLHLTGVQASFTAEHAAILLEGVSHVTIEDNIIDNCFFGIYAANSFACTISRNQVIGRQDRLTTAGNGIHLWYCRDIAVIGNSVSSHRDGIYMEFVRSSVVDRNQCRDNLRYGLHYMFSDSSQYAGNFFCRNAAGVAVMYTSNVLMQDNVFDQSWGGASYGLLLKDIRDSRVVGNKFTSNSIGVHIEGSDRIVLAHNLFKDNGWAMRLMANCLDNSIRENDFIDNSFAVATNSRQNHSSFDGNYWSDYRGFDLDRDGYGDTPFRPVSLFSLLVESHPPTLVLLRSLLVNVLDLAERTIPTLTPETLVDTRPSMGPNL